MHERERESVCDMIDTSITSLDIKYTVLYQEPQTLFTEDFSSHTLNTEKLKLKMRQLIGHVFPSSYKNYTLLIHSQAHKKLK